MVRARTGEPLNLMKRVLIFCAATSLFAGSAHALQTTSGEEGQCQGQDCVITYPRAFFDKYSPITAFDVVQNTPGFQIDEGDQSRGFAGAAGNVLINSERPSAKSESVSDILGRLPADAVLEVQLIRGQSGGLDLRGQSVVVNVILVRGQRRAVTYEVGTNTRSIDPGFYPFSVVSVSQSSDKLDITLGAEVERGIFQFESEEQVLGPADELLEFRDESYEEEGWEWKVSANGQARLGNYKIGFNAAYSDRRRDGGEISERLPTGDPAPFILFQGLDEDEKTLELGADIEREFGKHWSTKAVGLYRREDEGNGGSLARGSSIETVGLLTDSNLATLETETIARLETDYSGWKNHILELSGEYAVNELDSNLSLSLAETPGGDLVPIVVAGGETSIQETRGDFTLSDSWTLGKWVLDTTLAAETSTIRQTGDSANSRSFNFFKPSFAASYSPSPRVQWRARVERLIGQLNFNDFASSTDLGDDEILAGNPELSPDTRWRFSLASEWRFGDLGSLTLTAFHEEISDLVDVLPAANGRESIGNIGSATRTGVEFEGTLPLSPVLKGGRVDFSGFVQDSSVTDPVTSLDRRLSDIRNWELVTEFRQDFPQSKFTWGSVLVVGSNEANFGVDELDTNQRQIDLDVFAEITRFGGLRFRLEFGNAFVNGRIRNRRVFDGLRGINPLAFRELRDQNFGYRVTFSVRGNF